MDPIKTKKAQFLTTRSLVLLVLTAMFLVLIVFMTVKGCEAITKNPLEKNAKNNFNLFMGRAEFLNRNEVYSSSFARMSIPKGYYLIAFNDEQLFPKDIYHSSVSWTKPDKCNKYSSCICLYDNKPDTLNKNKNVVSCRNFDYDYILASTLFFQYDTNRELNYYMPGQSYKPKEFDFVEDDDSYLSFLGNEYDKILPTAWFTDKKYTNGLGITSPRDEYYYNFIIKLINGLDRDSYELKFFIESVNNSKETALIISPYNTVAALDRIKYVKGFPSYDKFCENRLCSEVINDNACLLYQNEQGKFVRQSDDLSKHNIVKCDSGLVNNIICVCDETIVFNGFCVDESYNDPLKGINFQNLPLNICDNVNNCEDVGTELGYESCGLNICDFKFDPNHQIDCNWNGRTNKCFE